MITFSLQSGSNGNAIYVESNGVRLLFDAGISGRLAERRMARYGRDIRDLDAVIISHDHRDHVRCAGVYQRKFGLPIYITRPSLEAAAAWCDLGQLTDVRHFRSGDLLTFGDTTVRTIRTAHDAVDGVAFVVEGDGRRLGILSDLGHPFEGLLDILESVDGAYLECNYDPDMLEAGEYPPRVRARIKGPGGHLSNDESAELLRACNRERPQWLAVAHLSAENNRPDLAIEAQHRAVGRSYPVYLAPRDGCSELLTL